ncbi:hypothetical protein Taro_044970 [Colocasia esculenta]|uniref:Uncharacterized protein n=1 Tax=Colocasia esculenta TaxID=4460 RepID=A0A843WVC7_COLES|nr:hypothetical protein [Colocasia esculenta]
MYSSPYSHHILILSVDNSVDTPLTGVNTMLQTQGKIMQNWSSSVDTRSSSVDTRDSFQKTFWPIWDSVSTLDQVVSTLEAFPEKTYMSSVTRKHISCSGVLTLLITL